MALQKVPDPYKRKLVPDPDGATVDFDFPGPYRAGSTSVYLNGVRLQRGRDNAWTELGGTTVRLDEPPLPGDSVWGEYAPA